MTITSLTFDTNKFVWIVAQTVNGKCFGRKTFFDFPDAQKFWANLC